MEASLWSGAGTPSIDDGARLGRSF